MITAENRVIVPCTVDYCHLVPSTNHCYTRDGRNLVLTLNWNNSVEPLLIGPVTPGECVVAYGTAVLYRLLYRLRIISASLSVSNNERKRQWCRPVAYPICLCVCLSVCLAGWLESVLWQNG